MYLLCQLPFSIACSAILSLPFLASLFFPLSVFFFSSWRCQRVPRKTEKVGR